VALILRQYLAAGHEEEFPILSPMSFVLACRPRGEYPVEIGSAGRDFPEGLVPGKADGFAVGRPTERSKQASNRGQLPIFCAIAAKKRKTFRRKARSRALALERISGRNQN
jgi:hypothetical protein